MKSQPVVYWYSLRVEVPPHVVRAAIARMVSVPYMKSLVGPYIVEYDGPSSTWVRCKGSTTFYCILGCVSSLVGE